MLGEIWNIQKNAFRKFCELECFVCAQHYSCQLARDRSLLFMNVSSFSSSWRRDFSISLSFTAVSILGVSLTGYIT